jgi:hypothetical protein
VSLRDPESASSYVGRRYLVSSTCRFYRWRYGRYCPAETPEHRRAIQVGQRAASSVRVSASLRLPECGSNSTHARCELRHDDKDDRARKSTPMLTVVAARLRSAWIDMRPAPRPRNGIARGARTDPRHAGAKGDVGVQPCFIAGSSGGQRTETSGGFSSWPRRQCGKPSTHMLTLWPVSA